MSQHDYTIANQNFPATRADINNALSAIATTNSGTSAPSTQYAGQFWIDTTTSTWTLYIHDGTDDIQFATIDTSANTVNFIDSALDVVTDSTPQLGGDLDLNSNDITGTGNINITGTIESSGNITGTLATASQPNITSVGTLTSFTSTGIDDNATSTAITIDSSENVGIGTSSPADALHIKAGSGKIRLMEGSQVDTKYAELQSSNGRLFLHSDKGNAEASSDMRFHIDNSEKMRIDSSGLVGIGTASPQNNLHIADDDPTIRLEDTVGDPHYSVVRTNNSAFVIAADEGNTATNTRIQFDIDASERMRINSSGTLLIGMTSESGATEGMMFRPGGESSIFRNTGTNLLVGGSQSGQILVALRHDATGIGSITKTGTTGIAYNTSSDYRLKENVNYDFDATTRLKQLKPARFNFIADANTTVDGFLAHEVQDIVPEAISGEKDETETKEKVVVNVNGQVIAENIEQADWEAGKIADEEGKSQYPTDSTWEATKVVPVYQGIDQAKLVPLLVKTIQELEARITALENA